jgi:soluble lytic murein transglycosylase
LTVNASAVSDRTRARGIVAVLITALLGSAAAGCSRHPPNDVTESTSAGTPPAARSVEVAKILSRELPTEDELDAGDAETTVIDFVRRESWDEAWTAIEALAEPKKRRPAMRLLRGRIAMARGDHATAVTALGGLENELLPIAGDIERWRAESQVHAGPFAEAAQYFSKQTGASALARAALAFEKAGMTKDARAAADRAIAAGKGDASEATVRALRARLAEADGDHATAIEDWRFIVLRAPADDEAKVAVTSLERLDPTRPLTPKERLGRADKWVAAGRTDDALAELDLAEKGASTSEQEEIAWARAFALYKARNRYEKAALAFGKLGNKKGPRQAEALYYAARASSRADHDEEAAKGYRALGQRFAMSPWADEATYLLARLSFLHAAWGEAATAYAAYLRKYRLGKQRDNATYERALALLADGKHSAARTELHGLAASASGAEAARLRQLEAVAARAAGDKSAAVSMWTDIVKSHPFTWAAIAARARLVQEGAEPPPMLEASDGSTTAPLAVKLPPVAHLYHRLGLDTEAEAYLRAHEREATVDAPGREKEALCALYGKLGRATRLYRIGLEAVPSALLARAPSPASEWAWRCVYPEPYADRVGDIETRENLPKGLIYAVMRQESGYDPHAVSRARAVGLLQLMPDTARRLAAEIGTPFDEKWLRTPSLNLELGGRYLAKTLRSFDGSIPIAAAAYNAGPGAARRWLHRMKVDLDLWVALIPYEETRIYVGRVMANFARYAYLAGGASQVPALELRPLSVAKEDASEY